MREGLQYFAASALPGHVVTFSSVCFNLMHVCYVVYTVIRNNVLLSAVYCLHIFQNIISVLNVCIYQISLTSVVLEHPKSWLMML